MMPSPPNGGCCIASYGAMVRDTSEFLSGWRAASLLFAVSLSLRGQGMMAAVTGVQPGLSIPISVRVMFSCRTLSRIALLVAQVSGVS